MNTFLLGVLTFCAVLLTGLAFSASFRFHHTLRKIHQLLNRLQLLSARANRAAGHVETTVHRACDAASGFLKDVERATGQKLVRAKKLLARKAGILRESATERLEDTRDWVVQQRSLVQAAGGSSPW